jgi:hypothetical protein
LIDVTCERRRFRSLANQYDTQGDKERSCRRGFGSRSCCIGDSDPGLDRSFTCISLLISRRQVLEALRHVSSSVLSGSKKREKTYLLLFGTERLPFVGGESGPLLESDSLHIGAMHTLAEEVTPGRPRTLHAALVVDELGLLTSHLKLIGARQSTSLGKLPLQRSARVVGKTDLIGCVRFDPGLVLSSAGFGELSSYVIVFL